MERPPESRTRLLGPLRAARRSVVSVCGTKRTVVGEKTCFSPPPMWVTVLMIVLVSKRESSLANDDDYHSVV